MVGERDGFGGCVWGGNWVLGIEMGLGEGRGREMGMVIGLGSEKGWEWRWVYGGR